MATTTPNFGWSVPTSSDLVKNGATAIETLGDSIDASLVDLKGGTTGQVLAKATNTDMDFSWVAQDDSNAIQNAIVDAKGDLIGATANDTPARLAVGTNGQVLTADSTAATGLAWATPSTSGTWTTWTPSIGNFTLGNGTANYRYSQDGKTVTVDFNIVLGSTTSVSGNPNFSLPVEAKYDRAAFTGAYTDAGAGFFAGIALLEQGAYSFISLKAINASGTYATFSDVGSAVPFTWTTNDEINFQFTYEAA